MALKASSRSLLEVRDITFVAQGEAPLRDLSLSFAPACFHAVLGEAQSGKRSLLRILGLFEIPDSGGVIFSGSAMDAISAEALAELRARRFGFIFSAPFLLSSFSVIENVAMPLFKIAQATPEDARRRTGEILEFVGLGEAAELPVESLSAESQYRAALARALVHEPPILLVEDLDGVLEGESLLLFTEVLRRCAGQFGTTVIATGSPNLPRRSSDRIIEIADGVIYRDSELLREPGA